MYGKILIKSDLKVLTGMHIGGSNIFSAIGSVDSPIVIDPVTRRPIIPGSSLKGKLRTLLARAMSGDRLPEHNKDNDNILRLFGSSTNPIVRSRLQFADAFVTNYDELSEIGLTEVKFENTIDRIKAVANPRQIERVISGVKFGVNIVYDVKTGEELLDDMKNIARAMKLLQLDYLGGHGTRGSGRVSFESFDIAVAECNIGEGQLEQIKLVFKDVESYALLSI